MSEGSMGDMEPFTTAIIAGGDSTRMGVNKALLKIGGKSIIERVMERTAQLGQAETILITNQSAHYAHLELPMYGDVFPGKGAMGGIYTAIHISRSPFTLVVACDLPFINPDLLRYMLNLRSDSYDVIVPVKDDHPQGTHAIYSKGCLEPIRWQLDAGRLKLIRFYGDVRVRTVDPSEWRRFDPDGLSFFNTNTPEDFGMARQLAEQSGDCP